MLLNKFFLIIFAEDITMGRDLEISIHGNCDLTLEPKDEPLTKSTGVGKGPLDLNSESRSSKQMHEDGGSGFKAISSHLQDNREHEAPNTHCKTVDTNEAAIKNPEEPMHVEHSSKRHRGAKDDETIVRDDRNVLRRSEGSAFSRYLCRIMKKKKLKFLFLYITVIMLYCWT